MAATIALGRTGAATTTLLASDRRRLAVHLARTVTLDRARRGAVAVHGPAGCVRRAEPGPDGPLILEARRDGACVALQVWGPASTPADSGEAALAAAAAWVGCGDDPSGFADVIGDHPVLRPVLRRIGEPRLSRLPRIGEAVGRAVISQLVQAVEAHRSTAQVAALTGTAAPGSLWCWPTTRQIGSTPAWALRRCGLSLRTSKALHAAAVCDQRLVDARHDWELLDRRLRTLPGIGAWTSAEVRLALGDPDAVSVGDYNLPGLVGHVLGDGPGPWDDQTMLTLLAPFTGQRGRVLRLISVGIDAGLLSYPRRRAPRAALSRHRYW